MTRISLYWYRTESNFGDAFSPMAVRHCFGREVSYGGKWSADMVAEGSVLGFTLLKGLPSGQALSAATLSMRAVLNRTLRAPIVIWGSGLLFPPSDKRRVRIRRPHVLALRGELTRRAMVRLGLLDARADIALGDPGVFMPEVLGVVPERRFGRGVVLHAYYWQTGQAVQFAKEHPEIRLIDPRRSPQEVVREIACCSEIFSSSLHGLVAADALGIPNRWVALETSFADARRNRFKFDDYYSALGSVREPCGLKDVAGALPCDPVPRENVDLARRRLKEVADRSGCPSQEG